MTDVATTIASKPQGAPASPDRSQRTFEPPGPGSWTLDAEHCERPHSRWISEIMPPLYVAGFREGMARYGGLLDTIEMRILHGFTYLAMRPLGAPPDATGRPPRAVFWLLTRLHPALRKRIRRSVEVLETRLWREDARQFFEEMWPEAIARFERMQALRLEELDDDALIAHLDELVETMRSQMHDHFMRACAGMLPVGDFIAHVREWTGCGPEEAIALLSGHSPYSVEVVAEMDGVCEAIRGDDEARRLLESEADGGDVLEQLCALRGPAGQAVRRWLDRVGQRIVTGHDVAELRGIELPGMLVNALRAHLAKPRREAERAAVERATEAMRARVPEAHRAAFDELLAEARHVHPLRDGHSVIDFWGFGMIRRGLLEAGRRLHARGMLHAPDHVVDLLHSEILSLLKGGPGPSADEVAEHAAWRADRSMADVPQVLGPEPGEPPPAEWLPGKAARVARAMNTYIEMMFTPRVAAPQATAVVTGTGCSPGKYLGRARLVLSPAEFSKVREGDVIVARITTPAYNVLLPLIGAVVTDRGGLLSHPAIVSREYGIPGVVGARDATTRIPDGATVEVDGDAGTVKVLG